MFVTVVAVDVLPPAPVVQPLPGDGPRIVPSGLLCAGELGVGLVGGDCFFPVYGPKRLKYAALTELEPPVIFTAEPLLEFT